MKVLHLADTHLGYSAYNKLDSETGINLRELDIYNSFKGFVDYALSHKPDLILHAGDLFDSVRPSNRAIAVCLEQLIRLSDAKIPVVMISGNHSTPRLRETGSVFRLLSHLKHIHTVYKGKYERVTVPELPDVCIHALPHAGTEQILKENLEAFKPAEKFKINIGMLHGAVVGVREFRSAEFNEELIPSGYLRPGFDYIALGHYHEFVEVEPNAYYAGSTERFSFNEVMHKNKGFIELELENGKRTINFISLQARPMVDIIPIDCSEIHSGDLSEIIIKKLEEVEPAGKILRLKLNNLPTGVFHTLDFSRIRKISREAVHYEQINNLRHDELIYQQGTSPKINKLSTEFMEFMKGFPVENIDKERLEKLGLDYISKEEA
jgi:DNA repair exonuclease SbcCD nuclease subunit